MKKPAKRRIKVKAAQKGTHTTDRVELAWRARRLASIPSSARSQDAIDEVLLLCANELDSEAALSAGEGVPAGASEDVLREIVTAEEWLRAAYRDDLDSKIGRTILTGLAALRRFSPTADLLKAAKAEFGWVIEHGASEISRPRYWGGVHGWTRVYPVETQGD